MNETEEVLRYLGFGNKKADERTFKTIGSCMQELSVIKPKLVSRTFPLTIDGGVLIGNLNIESKNLKKHLNGCDRAVLFAATLGTNADFLLERTSKTDIAKAVIMQACAAVKIESFCDKFQDNTAKQYGKEGYYLKPRYSPGYGDFPIQYQREIIKTLDCQKRIGLSMTGEYMLVPSKSVTAIIGLTKTIEGCVTSKCKNCGLKSCPFRKD